MHDGSCSTPVAVKKHLGWPLTWKPGNLIVVREKSWKKGKVRGNVFLHVVSYREYCSRHKEGVLYWVEFCIFVIVMTEYVSIAVRNNYCCHGRYSINIHLTCREKSGNLIMTGEWPS